MILQGLLLESIISNTKIYYSICGRLLQKARRNIESAPSYFPKTNWKHHQSILQTVNFVLLSEGITASASLTFQTGEPVYVFCSLLFLFSLPGKLHHCSEKEQTISMYSGFSSRTSGELERRGPGMYLSTVWFYNADEILLWKMSQKNFHA